MTERVMEWIKKEKLIKEGDCVIAGVSGGADSVCLLLLLMKLQRQMHFTLQVVHVEHGIRGEESREDALFVQSLCAQYGVPFYGYTVDVPAYAKEHGLGLEEAARLLRYACYEKEVRRLGEKAGRDRIKVALAHHADDNVETLLFQMARGSGIDGLGGMRAKRSFVEGAEIIRPLLTLQRREIEAYLKQEGQAYRTDSTNLDTTYSRNRIRHEILPKLSEINEQAISHMNQSARLLQQVSDYLRMQTAEAMSACGIRADCVRESGSCIIPKELFLAYPKLIQTEMLHRLLAELSGSSKDIGAVHVEVVCALFYRQVGRQLDLPYAVCARRVYEGVLLSAAHCREDRKIEEASKEYGLGEAEKKRLEAGEEIVFLLPEGQIKFHILEFSGEIEQIYKKKYTKWLNYDMIKGDLQVRKRREGDYLTVDLQGHRKKLKEYFVNEKIPQKMREEIWLLTEEAHVIWVVGGRISANYKISEQTKRILEVQIVGGKYHEN